MHPPTKFSLRNADGQEMQFPPQRPVLLALVKEDCETCNLTLPLLEAVHRATDDGLDVWVAVQKSDDIPILKDRHDLTMPLLDDDALDLSYETDIDTVPTLFLYDEEQNCTLQTFGFDKHEWREIASESMALAGRPDGDTAIDWDALPVQRPGCGARNYEPGVYERLQAIKSGDLLSRLVDLAAKDDIHEFMYEQGYTDGFPVVPPTRERVWQMLQGTSRDPQEEVAIMPPNLAPITVEKIAINAVMAGAKPEYMPSIITLVEIACTETFNIHGVLATTMGATPVGIFNGPIRDRIGMNYLHSALGSGNRANAAIGRALRLCARNVGGSLPGGTDRATQGGPHRLTMNFAENEDANPWDSLAVERGFAPTDDVATLMAMSGGPATIADERSRDGRGMAGTLAMSMSCMQDPKSPMVDTLVVLSPDHAGIFGRSGWSKGRCARVHHGRNIHSAERTAYVQRMLAAACHLKSSSASAARRRSICRSPSSATSPTSSLSSPARRRRSSQPSSAAGPAACTRPRPAQKLAHNHADKTERIRTKPNRIEQIRTKFPTQSA